MNPLDEWIESYRDDSLTDSDREKLETALSDSPEARKRFIAQMSLSAHLQQREVSPQLSSVIPFSQKKKTLVATGIAASLAFAALLLFQNRPATTSTIVAVITNAEDAVWENGSSPSVGASLDTGRWDLASGRLEVALENGAELYLDGPLSLEVASAFRTTLHSGNLSARIPPSALGFRVITPEIEVIDLGTEFSVSVASDGESAIRVLDGFVDARPLDGSATQRLARSEKAVFGGDLGGALPAFNLPRPLDSTYPTVAGDIRILYDRPGSLAANAYEHDYLLAFRERHRLTLPESLTVDMIEPGASPHSAHALWKQDAELPATTMIDSWMIHFDGVEREQLVCEAELAFPTEILAVIATSPSLNSSDAVLGLPDAIYPAKDLRGVEFYAKDPYQIDEIVLSGDRRHLKLRWHVSTQIDQIRILTATAP